VDLLVRAIRSHDRAEIYDWGLQRAAVGEGSVKRLGLDRVRFRRPLPPEQLVEAYARRRVVRGAIPRGPEPFGMVGIEPRWPGAGGGGGRCRGDSRSGRARGTGYGSDSCDVGGAFGTRAAGHSVRDYERLAESARERAAKRVSVSRVGERGGAAL
jgi:hypothetical protein